MERNDLLEAAGRISSRLCREALFDEAGRLCNWMGRHDVEDSLIAPYSVRSAALGPELYGGSAGVALFLAELYGVTGDEPARQTALAAIRRSVHYMNRYPTGANPVSFFAGHLGMAYVASRLMDLDASAGLEAELAWLVEAIVQEEGPPPLDVIGGCAGAISPLLRLSQRPGLAKLAEVAVRCGEEICQAARWENGLCRWELQRVIGQEMSAPPATGFAHGASGLALALLALYAHTGEERYRDTARGAIRFEETFYSEADRNWVDTRFPYTREDEGKIKGTFQQGWCHGAPGIALARMHAAILDPATAVDVGPRAAAGVTTAVTAIADRLAQPDYDATLCHGLGGIAAVVLRYGELCEPGYKEKAAETAQELVRRYGAAGDWPSGVNAGGPNPSLMIGTAGIGYHLLRLSAGERVPCILSLLL